MAALLDLDELLDLAAEIERDEGCSDLHALYLASRQLEDLLVYAAGWDYAAWLAVARGA